MLEISQKAAYLKVIKKPVLGTFFKDFTNDKKQPESRCRLLPNIITDETFQ